MRLERRVPAAIAPLVVRPEDLFPPDRESQSIREGDAVALGDGKDFVHLFGYREHRDFFEIFFESSRSNEPSAGLYAHADKPDAPSGTTRELAEELASISQNRIEVPIAQTHGIPQARGATIGGTQVHSVRLPSYVIGFEAIFGLPDERLTIRHDAGSSAMPYVGGTLMALQKVMTTCGLVRGLDRLLFSDQA